ncbi:MAG: response regulator, partial [Porphyrobacter sp.]|nr:response regulator [Porphyrobacter sp.]
GIAHDFNNLLAAVLGGLRLIEGRVQLGEREQQIFEQMRHAAEKGAELVRRLMAFARKQELSPSSIDAGVLRKSVAGLVDHALGDEITVDWQLRDEGLRVYADEAQLELALVNLLINARDAMPGGGTIAVAIEADGSDNGASSGEWLRIAVRDEGSGIAPDLIERVTEPFFTTKEAGKGTGLGLSMVAGFVEQSGGVFRIASELGRGTQIEMILPATRAEAEAATAPAPQQEPERLVGSVLLVDDDAGVRLILAEHLRDLGLEVAVAEDAQQALKLLESTNGNAPDFVLTDFSMPGMDGLNLLGAIGDRWPNIRGAIMTGNPQERVSRCDPHVAVIHKPIDAGELKRLLAAA